MQTAVCWTGVLAVASSAEQPVPTKTPPLAIDVGPVLQSPTTAGATVTWLTNRPATATVEFGPVGGELQSVFASHHGLIDGNTRLHHVALRGLRPGTTYRYRVISREIVEFRHWKIDFGATAASEFRQFRVVDPAQPGLTFLVFNDIHGQPATIPELRKAAGTPAAELVVFNGDIVSFVDDENQITTMLQQITTEFSGQTPFLWVRGNHETRGKLARQLPAYLGLPEDRFYYAFTQGPVHFLVLDTGEDKIDGHKEYSGMVDFFRYRREEGEWLKSAVQTDEFRRAKYRVVICHMPFPIGQSPEASKRAEEGGFLGMADAFANFGPTLDAAGIDLMISGHTHRPAIVQPETGRHRYPIVIGGGNRGDGRTIIRAAADAKEFTATIVRADGTTVGTCRVPAKR